MEKSNKKIIVGMSRGMDSSMFGKISLKDIIKGKVAEKKINW